MPNVKPVALVVDDEVGIIKLVTAILKGEGYDVITAESGYAGFSTIEKRVHSLGEPKIDVIISDWVMQGWDGLKLLAEIRSRPYGNVPFILMSGAVTREQLEEAARARAVSVLLKPIVKEVLLAKVAEAIEKFRAPKP